MALFDNAIIYKIEAKCVSPLHTGDSGAQTDEILVGSDGRAIIQGSSLAGAMRAFAGVNCAKVCEGLFGSNEKEGRLIISEGVFEDTSPVQFRTRLRIDSKSGSALKGAKFDVRHIGAGSIFKFSITYLGTERDMDSDAEAVEKILAAMDNGIIRLGAYKTSGYGRVKLEVFKQVYHMKDESERRAWLKDEYNGRKLDLAKAATASAHSGVNFNIKCEIPEFLIKAATFDFEKKYTADTQQNVVQQNIIEDEYDEKTGKKVRYVIIPGTSIKGVIRNRVQIIADWLEKNKSIENIGRLPDEMFGTETGDGKKGLVLFDEVRVRYNENVNSKCCTRIRINKFTGGVIEKALINEEPVSAAAQISISMPGDADDESAAEKKRMYLLMLYALRDLGLGLYNLGGGQSIGRGYVKVAAVEVSDGTRSGTMYFDENRNISCDDKDGMFKQWMDSLEV